MGVYGFSGKDVRRLRKSLQAYERTPQTPDDARPGNPPQRTGSTRSGAIFLTPAGGIPAATSAVKPGFTNCERWYRNKSKNEYEPSGTFETVYSRATKDTPANVLITAVDVDGDWEMAILICNAPLVTRVAGAPSSGTSPGVGTGPNSGAGGRVVYFAAPGTRIGAGAAGGAATGAGAGAGAGGGLVGGGGPPPP